MAHGTSKQLQVRGFTLVELMTTLVILTVILLISVPGLVGMFQTSKVRAAQSELVSALVLARSEAVKRNVPTQVIAVTQNFSEGWVVQTTPSQLTPSSPRIPAILIRNFPDISAAVQIRSWQGDPTTRVYVVPFQADGFVRGGTFVLNVCGKSDVSKGYRITVPPIGLADVTEVDCV